MIDGGGDNDLIYGMLGNDLLIGFEGLNEVHGTYGNNKLIRAGEQHLAHLNYYNSQGASNLFTALQPELKGAGTKANPYGTDRLYDFRDPYVHDNYPSWSSSQPWHDYSYGDMRRYGGKIWRCINPIYAFQLPSQQYRSWGWIEILY